MSSFMTYSLNGHEHMSISQVFKQRVVERTAAVDPAREADDGSPSNKEERHDRWHRADQAYHAVKQLRQDRSIIVAEQIMAAPVVTITIDARVTDALKRFHVEGFRHLPVVTSAGRLVGILSDRDALRHLAGLNDGYQPQLPLDSDGTVEQLMAPRVLTASVDTDVRYIARLFVEQHIGAVPIMQAGRLAGIITRSDVLRAVMRHYALELWV